MSPWPRNSEPSPAFVFPRSRRDLKGLHVSDTTTIERPAIGGAIIVPINLLAPSPTNPRKHFDPAKLTELAESIKKHSVLQPILARPHPKATAGHALYEIVAGERRWRASNLAEMPTMPVLVRELTDFEVLEIQVIENLQRDDLTVLEEAEGYRALMRKPDGLHGYVTADELADRLGKSRRYVFNRLKLCDLGKTGRDALSDGTLSPSVALLVARLPSEHQPEAVKMCVQGFGGEPLTFRAAQDRLEREFMLQLAKAPFKITDASLVPDAGSCRECTKRTGANPDLFDDIKSADTCTDRKCFQLKTARHHAAVLAEGKAKGLEVITGAQAKKVMPYAHSEPKGYLKLDETNYQIDGSNKLRKLLGKDAPPTVLVENPHTHAVVEMVRADAAIQVLKDKGVIKTGKLPSSNAAEREAVAKAKAATEWRTAAAAACMKAVADPSVDGAAFAAFMWPELALRIWHGLGNDDERRCERLLGWEHIDYQSKHLVEDKVRALDMPGLARMFVAMTLVGEVHVGTYNSKPNDAPTIERFAKQLGVDVAGIRRGLAKPAKVASKASAKVAKGRSTPPMLAAAQGAKSGPRTPEEALAKTAQTEAPGHAGKTREHPVQKVDAAAPRAQAHEKAKASPSGSEQKVEAASPQTGTRRPAVGERWQPVMDPGAAWPFPTANSGKVITIDGDQVVLVSDDGTESTRAVDQLNFITAAPTGKKLQEAKARPAETSPFPKSQGGSR